MFFSGGAERANSLGIGPASDDFSMAHWPDQSRTARATGARRLAAPAASILILLAGFGIIAWRAKTADFREREALRLRIALVARSIDTAALASLHGDADDLRLPAYQRLKRQLELCRPLLPACRFLYLMGRGPDGAVHFLLDSEPPTSKAYSPPGQAYGEASDVLRRSFTSGEVETEGPIADRWGVWISALAPVFDGASGKTMAVVGMDVDASTWRMHIARQSLPLALVVLAIYGVTAAGWMAIRQRARLGGGGGWILRHAELLLCIALGLSATVGLVDLAAEVEAHSRSETFMRLASSQIDAVTRVLSDIRRGELESLARFFDSSDFVDRDEFARYADFSTRQPFAQAWLWIPAVAASEAAGFAEAVRRGGAPDFAVWQPGPDGQRVEPSGRITCYPICYASPSSAVSRSLGFDIASQPALAAAIEETLRSGLMTASDPVPPIEGSGDVEIYLLRPVHSRVWSGRLDGFAVAVVRVQELLRSALSSVRADSPVCVDVSLLRAGQAPLRLGRTAADPAPKAGLTIAAPLLVCGQTLAVTCHPSEIFHRFYPARAALRAGLTGLSLTGLLVALVAFQRNRQVLLERLVAERTNDLRVSESSYHGLFDSIRQAIYILDREGRFIDVNLGALAMYRCSRDYLVGRTPADLSVEDRNDLAEVGAKFEAALAGRPQFMNFWARRPDGTIFPKDVWLCRGSYFGASVVIAVANDVTARYEQEAERARLQAELQQAQKLESIGRLAGGVAHDFNNMLQTVLGNADLALADIQGDGALREHLVEIRRAAERSADLARQLLAFASRQTVAPRVLDLNETIGGLLKMLRRLIGEDIRLRWEPAEGLWPVKLDPSQVDQVLANLAVNARDAIGGVGQVRIATANVTCDEACQRRYPGCAGGEYVEVTVSDDGRGMDADTAAHIFEPFFTTKPAGQGTGLGLAIVFGIVRQNNGFIGVETAPGAGATFRILLPRAEAAARADAPAAPAAQVRRGGECLLLVEDDVSILKLGQTALARLGYRVLPTNSPLEAVGIARAHEGEIHLLVTDVVLPEMNGRDLARQLGAIRPQMKCLYMSGYTADVIARRGVLDESVCFLQKPFTMDALAAKVREVLDGDRSLADSLS